jgi:hypothetical protein
LKPALIAWHPVGLDLSRRALADPRSALRASLEGLRLGPLLGRDSRVAVAVGSRGIPGISSLVAEVVAALRARGAEPFVVPAMGTHGGVSPSEQAAVLGDLGVTEAAVRAPVVSRPEVIRAGETASGVPVWVDAAAWAADAVVPVNRVKPHTAFRGSIESGPSKLLAVGLGKGESARAGHRAGLAQTIPEITRVLLGTGKVPFGVAVVENPSGGLAEVSVLEPERWLEQEADLLRLAWQLYPRLPWAELDLLVVERIGKDVSGTGMDLNVIGMERRFPGCGGTRIRRIVVLDLTEKSRGNATGLGYADVTTRRLAEKIDWHATNANCRTTGFVEAARLPFTAADEEEAIAVALESLNLSPEYVRAARIVDTAHLERFQVSPALLAELPEGVRWAEG